MTSGVQQGCVLAPALFCRAIDWILVSSFSITLGQSLFTDLDYADDAVFDEYIFRVKRRINTKKYWKCHVATQSRLGVLNFRGQYS